MTRRTSYRQLLGTLLAAVLVALSVPSCNYRDIDLVYYETSDVWVAVDWSEFTQEEPSGMSVYCYPMDNPEHGPYVFLTNNTAGVMATLPIGHYNIIVFNQSVDEFGSLHFSGMDDYDTATAVLEPFATKWMVKSDNQEVCYEPEWLAIDTFEGLEVTLEAVKASAYMRQMLKQMTKADLTKADPATKASESIALRPRNVVFTATATISVDGINNARSVRGSITGMAEGFRMSSGQRTMTSVTHALETWGMTHDKDDYNVGEVFASFRTFGLPGWVTKVSSGSTDVSYNPMLEAFFATKSGSSGTKAAETETNTKAADDPADNLLNVSFLLVDNKTTCDYSFPVGDMFEVNNLQLKLNLQIRNRDIALPEVEPEGGSGGGFSATVDDWGEEQEIDVPLM